MPQSNPNKVKADYFKILIDTVYSRTAVLFFLSLIVSIFGSSFISKLNIFDGFKESTTADVVFICGIVLVMFRYFHLVYVEHYILSRSFTQVIFVLSLNYLVLRFAMTDTWTFVTLKCSNYFPIAYLDVIFVFGGCELFFYIKSYFSNNVRNDESVEVKNPDDNFGREYLVATLVSKLEKLNTNQSAQIIGIAGEWGSGKSWFLERLCEVYKNRNTESVLINFNSWISDGKTGLITSFFTSLSAELSKRNGNLSKHINNYLKLFTDNAKIKVPVSVGLDFAEPTSMEIELEKINDAIQKIGKKVIIVIDDLDRLGDGEILDVLQILRMTSKYKNVIFLVGYDRQYLNNAIQKLNAHNYERFLDKIFHVQIPLPTHPDKFLLEAFRVEFKGVIENEVSEVELRTYYIKSFDSLFEESSILIQKCISDLIKNRRELDILISKLSINIVYLKEQKIVLSDLILLELLSLESYATYESIRKKELSNLRLSTKYSFVNTNFRGSNRVANILELLFNSEVKERGIANPLYFELYFGYVGRIPLYEFNKLLEGHVDNLKLKIDDWKKLDLENELWAILIKRDNFAKKVEFENLFEALLYLNNGKEGSQLPQVMFEILSPEKRLNNIMDLYGDNKVESFLDAVLSISLKYPKDNVFGYLSGISRSVIENNALMDFGVRYLEGIIKNGDYKTIEKIVSFATLDERSKDNTLKLDPDILGVFYNYVSQHPLEFVTHCISEIKQTELFELYHFTEQLFGTYKKFEEFLYNQAETIEALELKTFYRRFEANNYKPIEFTRGTIEIISSSETEFCGSQTYYKNFPRQKSSQFVHPNYQMKIETEHPDFRNVPWIAKDKIIDNRDEQFYGDTYNLRRNFDIKRLDCVKSITLQFFVDDLLTKATLNGELIFENVETGSHMLAIKSFTNIGFVKGDNELEFEIHNYPFSKVAPQRGIDTVQPGDNPYGIIYILELHYDMDKLKTEKVYEPW